MMILKLTVFVLCTLLVLFAMGYLLWKLYRGLKIFYGHDSEDIAERILDTADQLGVDTSGVRKLIEVTIGEKICDLGPIEARAYGRLEIEYSAWVSRADSTIFSTTLSEPGEGKTCARYWYKGRGNSSPNPFFFTLFRLALRQNLRQRKAERKNAILKALSRR